MIIPEGLNATFLQRAALKTKKSKKNAQASLYFEVADLSNTTLWSTLVPATGKVSGSFTPTVSDDYLMKLVITNLQKLRAAVKLDNFYAYTVPSSASDFVSLLCWTFLSIMITIHSEA